MTVLGNQNAPYDHAEVEADLKETTRTAPAKAGVMQAVVNTNILIRAVIKPDGTVGPVLQGLVQGDDVSVYSRPLFVELLEKLELSKIAEKYDITRNDIADLMALFVLRGDLVISGRTATFCRDPEDNIVIEAALAGEAP